MASNAAAVKAPDTVPDVAKASTRRHITDQPMTLSNWYKQVNWLSTTLIIFIPMIGFASAFYTPLKTKTAIFAVAYYFFSGLGITAGYHRLWAHRAYKATLPLKIFLIVAGSAAVEGSARWWSRDHRSHHRYTDTDKDPYSVRKGLMYSHLGWMVFKQNPKRIGRTNISDLNADWVVVWQHKNYLKSVLISALGIPILVCGLGWNDWWGGLVYAGILRVCFVQQATFCVNSLAHWLGEQPFDDRDSPRDHIITALVTLGEGYHNYHHEFPMDYRNGIYWYQYDPTKWFIRACSLLGLATHLKTIDQEVIEKGRIQQDQKKIEGRRAKLNWGVPLSKLPQMSWDEYKERCEKGERLIAIGGVIHDVTNFIADHPGGEALISSGVGVDATAMFNGGVYDHHNAAHNLLASMRCAVLTGGGEVEIWKRTHLENMDAAKAVDSSGREIVRANEQVTRVPQPIASAEAA